MYQRAIALAAGAMALAAPAAASEQCNEDFHVGQNIDLEGWYTCEHARTDLMALMVRRRLQARRKLAAQYGCVIHLSTRPLPATIITKPSTYCVSNPPSGMPYEGYQVAVKLRGRLLTAIELFYGDDFGE